MIEDFEKVQTFSEVENFLLKESIKECLQKNVELKKELTCRTAKFENVFAKLEKQSLEFELQ